MPAIITPPDLERRPRRTEENDGGHGRRPPNGRDLKRTGGGGDNDNWNESPGRQHRPGERCLPPIASASSSPSALSGHSSSSASSASSLSPRPPATSTPTATTSTRGCPPRSRAFSGSIPLVLLLSTVTVEIARRRMFHQIDAMEEWFGLGKPTSRRALPWLIATLVLGLLFPLRPVCRVAPARRGARLLRLQPQQATPSTS